MWKPTLVYHYVRPDDDRGHKGASTSDDRDKAEQARNTLLSALLDRSGADAYQAVLTLSAEEAFRSRAIHFKELARRKAEQDAEPPAWTPGEVLAFERDYNTPAKTGESLLNMVIGVLSDIQSSFNNADATSRSVAIRAKNENEIQQWLTEQLNLRSKGRFHAHREAQVAGGDKPDIIASSTAAHVETAIEVKHGGKKWSVRDLENALTKQLAKRYLKPSTRRWGVLVISYHGNRTWRDPDTRATLRFSDLIQRLQTHAASVVGNDIGSVQVRVLEIDLCDAE